MSTNASASSNNNNNANAAGTNVVINLYRHCTLGVKLSEALDELKNQDKISDEVAEKVMKQFDKSMCNALSTRLTNKCSLKADQCLTFNFNNNVYVWTLKDVDLKLGNNKYNGTLDYVKIVACDGTTNTTKKTSRKRKK
ncbi:hypothetical protein ABK040_008847 [Willaertia magna]